MEKIYSKYQKILHLDIETFSSNDIKLGVYKYADADDFEIMLIGYAYDNEEVQQIQLARGEKIPKQLREDILSPLTFKIAHNASFERICLSRYLLGRNKYLDPHSWFCTMVMSSMLGLAKSLEDVGNLLNLRPEDKKKSVIGNQLIRFFALPQIPKRTNNFRTRNRPNDDLEKWELYCEYNRNDVIAEREIFNKEINYLNITPDEYEMYCVDAKINDLGVGIDLNLCSNIQAYLDSKKFTLNSKLKELTGLENPNSTQQIIRYLNSKGIETSSINKDKIEDLISMIDDEKIIEILTILQSTKKTSVSKYQTMLNSAIYDSKEDLSKCHGTLQYCGASRTWRWAGRLIQTQNLPRNSIKHLKEVREFAMKNDFESIELMYSNTLQIMSELIRTAMIPAKNSRFVVCDYNAIESRVAAWLADEKWKLRAFEEGKGIYEATASKMFNIPIESISHDSVERAKGKIAELAGQYQGGIGAYKRFGADKYGLTDSQIKSLVDTWRDSNKGIVKFWDLLENGCKKVILNPGLEIYLPRGLSIKSNGKILFIKLPSKRSLAYQSIGISNSKIYYYGESSNSKWTKIETYGGKLFENVVQAIARDCLKDAILALDKQGLTPRFHIHDEVIISVPYSIYPNDEEILEKVKQIMAKAAGNYDTKIPLRAAGYTCNFYLKD